MGIITRIRLDGGTDQSSAKRVMPESGPLRRVTNMRLSRDGELEVRPGYAAMARTTYGGSNLVAYDLVNYNERLIAIGTNGGARRLYEFVDQSLAAWKGSAGAALSYATEFRDMGRPPDQRGDILGGTLAVDNGIALLAFATQDGLFVHVFRVADDATLAFESFGNSTGAVGSPRALVTDSGGAFVVVAFDSGTGELKVRDFEPATDTSLSGLTTLFTVTGGLFAAARVRGGSGYVVAGVSGTGVIVRHYSAAHVQQMTVTIATTVPKALSICADSSGNTVSILYVDNTDDLVKVITRNLTTGAAVQGPTTVSSGQIAQADSIVSIKHASSTSMRAAYTLQASGAAISSVPPLVQTRTIVPSTHALGTAADHISAELTSEVLVEPLSSEPVFAHVYGEDGQRVNVLTEHGGPLLAGKDFGIAQAQDATNPDAGTLAMSLTSDDVTGKFYWVNCSQNNDGERGVTVTEFELHSTARRQTAEFGGLLYIAGGMLSVYDGRQLFESGFIEAPMLFVGLASDALAGNATSGAKYLVQLHAEWLDARRNVHLSQPSIVYELTLGAADKELFGAIMGLHSMRRVNAETDALGSSLRLVIHRTAALTDKTSGENLFREVVIGQAPGDTFGAADSFFLTDSDAQLRAKLKTVYTQSQTPIPHAAPPPCRYIWSSGGRLHLAGLPQADLMVHSKLLFPAEAGEFATLGRIQFESRFGSDIIGVASVDEAAIGFTRSGIAEVRGEGPDHAGLGEFIAPDPLDALDGLIDDGWRSLLKTHDGLFYQADSTKLYLMGGDRSTVWVNAIQEELAAYPVIVAATHCRAQHCCAFAVQSSDGTDGAILIYDLRRHAWFVDTGIVPAALTTYLGRLVVADTAGLPFLQDLTPGTGAMPTQTVETYAFDFSGADWGSVTRIGISGEKVGDCTIQLELALDDGAFSVIETFAVTTANGFTNGRSVDLLKAPPVQETSRYSVRATISGGSATGGVRLNGFLFETDSAPGVARRPGRDTR